VYDSLLETHGRFGGRCYIVFSAQAFFMLEVQAAASSSEVLALNLPEYTASNIKWP